MAEFRYRWARIGDINAFFGLMLDNMSDLVIMAGILIGVFGFPKEIPKEQITKELLEQFETGVKSSETPEAKKRQDNQIARAVDLLKGIKVYERKEKINAALN